MLRTVCGGGVIAVIAVTSLTLSLHRDDSLGRLVKATAEMRPIEARLSGGFRWAPYRSIREIRSTNRLRGFDDVAHAAAIVRQEATRSTSIDARRSAAVALLFEGKSRAAVQELESVAAFAQWDGRVRSDLAAARLHVAIDENVPGLLPEALAAADSALRLQPGLVEGLFNRALILERLGIRDQASEAWSRYLDVDTSSEWAVEVRDRVRSLAPLPPFQQLLDRNFPRLAHDPLAAHDMARSSPLEARLYGETVILSQWADKETSDDRASASEHLRIAREFGEELARNGDGMLKATVAAIDRADAEQTGHLIRGHLLYRRAQAEFKSDRAESAQPLFVSAAREFDLGGSPLKIGAEYYLAHTFHTLGQLPEARAREKRLLKEIAPVFPAYRAQVLWHLGLGYTADGLWGNALTALTESAATFERLRETAYASFVRELLAEVYDRIGDPDSAWEHRVVAWRGVGAHTSFRLEQSLEAAGRSAMMRRQLAPAASLLGLASEAATRAGRPVVEVQTRLLQARLLSEMTYTESAQQALARARVAASLIPDAAAKEDADAEIVATNAIICATPAEAVRLLTKAIEYQSIRGRRIALPELYFHRARAHREMRKPKLAAADLETGVAIVERCRESLPEGEVRWGVFDPSYELFEEAIDLALADGDTRRAFAFSERARSRELLDGLKSDRTSASPSQLEPNASVVEYIPFNDRLVILVASRDGVHAVKQRISRSALERDGATFAAAVAAESPDRRRLAMELHRRLIEPIESELMGTEKLVLVPGASLAAVPFVALENAAHVPLVERFSIVVTPSAAVYEELSLRKRPVSATPRLLVMANPITDPNVEPLPETEIEANRIAVLYQRRRVLLRESATVAAFSRDAAEADVIHLATHGESPLNGRAKPALILAGSRLDAGQIEVMHLRHTSVALLAACSSARGPVRSEGTLSISRAFLAAGVPSVIATLWSIDDSASASFFPLVHKYLARGLPADRALREAQRDAIRNGVPASLWAAVQCIGS